MDSSTYGQPVTKLVLKLTLNDVISNNFHLGGSDHGVNSINLTSVIEELNIQTDVALKTLEYLEPLCPSPLYFNETISIHLLREIAHNAKNDLKKILQKLMKHVLNKDVRSVSFIVMELAENYKSLHQIMLETPSQTIYEYMAAYLLLKLAIETGYAHGDPHRGNILINLSKSNYFNGLSGAPLLIDFGYAAKMLPKAINKVKTFCNNKQYTNALNVLYEIPRKDGEKLDSHFMDYEYIFNFPSEFHANQQIDNLFKRREEFIEQITATFEREHATKPDVYPLLPLSKSFRNQLYSGVDVFNKTVVPVFGFTHLPEVRLVNDVLDWVYDVLVRSFFFSPQQLNCFFILFCGNFVYILNNVGFVSHVKNTFLCGLIALLFVDHFDILDNNEDTTTTPMEFLIKTLKDKGFDFTEKEIKQKTNMLTPLFEHKRVDSMYAPYFAQWDLDKDDLIDLMLNPTTYADPQSELSTSSIIPNEEEEEEEEKDRETYAFPFEEEEAIAVPTNVAISNMLDDML